MRNIKAAMMDWSAAQLNAAMAVMGRKGGLARAKRLTKAERVAQATKAAQARWHGRARAQKGS